MHLSVQTWSSVTVEAARPPRRNRVENDVAVFSSPISSRTVIQ